MYDILQLCRENGKNTELHLYIDKSSAPYHARRLLNGTAVHVTYPMHYFQHRNISLLADLSLDRCVIKGTHLSGFIASIQGQKITKCLKRSCQGKTPYDMCQHILVNRQSYYVESRMYGAVRPGCIIEKQEQIMEEYKWICFRGYCPFMAIISDSRRAYFQSNMAPIHHFSHGRVRRMVDDAWWTLMKRAARQLSTPFPYVRIDFSRRRNRHAYKLHFDEFTFTPAACTNLVHQQQHIAKHLAVSGGMDDDGDR